MFSPTTNNLPNGFVVPETNCWDSQKKILNSKKGYWARIKQVCEMTARERDQYLGRHLRRLSAGGDA